MRPILMINAAVLCALAVTTAVPGHAQVPDEAPDIVREYPTPVDETAFAFARVCMSEADIHARTTARRSPT